MAEYIRFHGPQSSVDWQPSLAKARAEISRNDPFVVLCMLTSSGHYITCTGFVANKPTLIFNDPWGNKNVGYPNYRGAGAQYDWPGQNNGHQNLSTASCFIYCRR
jgi:hypothetical protein